MFSSFFGSGKKAEIAEENLRIYRNVRDRKLTPVQRKAQAGACIDFCVKNNIPAGIYPAERDKNLFTAALANNDIETFAYLAEHPQLTLAAAFNPTATKTPWLTLAFNSEKYDFIETFFEKRAAFRVDDVKSLTINNIIFLLNTLETLLHHPRLYHLADLLLEKAIMPIFEYSVHAQLIFSGELQSTLRAIYEKIFDALAFQAGNPPTKSTQLFGLLRKHGMVERCEVKHTGEISITFKMITINPHHIVTKTDKNQYYLSLLYLFNHQKYHPKHNVLLHCHHYFHLKQEYRLSSKDQDELITKLRLFIQILDLIKANELPAAAVKAFIEQHCAKHSGHSDFRDTIFPLANMRDAALKGAYDAYVYYVTEQYTQYLRAQGRYNPADPINIDLNEAVILKALYVDSSNPLIEISEYLDSGAVKNLEEKQAVFQAILEKINAMGAGTPNALKDFLKAKKYTSTIQVVAPQPNTMIAPPSLAHFAPPHTGQFANMVCALKQWDGEALQIKAREYNAYLEDKRKKEEEDRRAIRGPGWLANFRS